MHPHEIHHIKAYVVFVLLSATLIGILVYLYIPTVPKNSLGSSAFPITPVSTTVVPTPGTQQPSTQNVGESNITPLPISETEASKRRIRLVKMLMRYKKDLQTLENQRSVSLQGLDTVSEEKMKQLREKITSTEKLIIEIQ